MAGAAADHIRSSDLSGGRPVVMDLPGFFLCLEQQPVRIGTLDDYSTAPRIQPFYLPMTGRLLENSEKPAGDPSPDVMAFEQLLLGAHFY